MAPRKSADHRVPGWVWLFTGVMLGAFVMFLVNLSKVDEREDTTLGSQSKQAPKQKEKERTFDFYTLLKETEVPVDNSVAEDYEPVKNANGVQKEYLLQVASFTELQDAEQLRAELILLNLQAHIEQANIRDGEKWHRVIVGPFADRSQFAKARSTLISNRYEAMVFTRPKS